MKQTINESEFLRAFKDMNRTENFSRDGLIALFDYLEQEEEDLEEDIELDVIAICCDFAEYKDLKEFQGEHNKDFKTIEDIKESTEVIEFGKKSFIIKQF